MKVAHRTFCRSRELTLPQNNKLDLRLPMLKMHKWRGEVVKMSMHYALCTFAHKCTGRARFPPGPDAFSEILHFLLYAQVTMWVAGTRISQY